MLAFRTVSLIVVLANILLDQSDVFLVLESLQHYGLMIDDGLALVNRQFIIELTAGGKFSANFEDNLISGRAQKKQATGLFIACRLINLS